MPEKFTGTVEILGNGKLVIRDAGGREAIVLDDSGNARFGQGVGELQILHGLGLLLLHGPNGPAIAFGTKPVPGDPPGQQAARISLGGSGLPGSFTIRDDEGRPRVEILGSAKSLIVRDEDGKEVFALDSKFAVIDLGGGGGDGDLRIRDGNGNIRIHLDGKEGDLKLTGADCAEVFKVVPSSDVVPGAVLVVGADGRLRACEQEYDRRVAGVVAGAGGLRPGLVLGRCADHPSGVLLTLTGRVWCRVDASRNSIEAGDLLTTSATPGYAMKASDPAQMAGAIVGKALEGLRSGTRLVPVLAALQ